MQFDQTITIFRIFDEDKACEIYLGFLGFMLDWEHRFETNLPLYTQVSRAGLTLHLSALHGDGTPGSTAFFRMTGIAAVQSELLARNYNHMRPGLQSQPWGQEKTLIDPFGNTLRFCKPA